MTMKKGTPNLSHVSILFLRIKGLESGNPKDQLRSFRVRLSSFYCIFQPHYYSSLIINGNPGSKCLIPSIAELVNFIHLVSWTCSYSSQNRKSVRPHSYPWLRRLRKQSSLFVVDMKYAFLK